MTSVADPVKDNEVVERPPVPGQRMRLVHEHQHPYPDVFDPAAPYPFYKLHPLFRPGVLTSAKGKPVTWEELRGKSVALYFADDSKCKCKTFLPVLTNAYRTYNESGDTQKVEIVFVSLDETEEAFHSHRARQPWLTLPFGDPLIDAFKQHFRVMNPNELLKYGYGPRTSPPALLIVASNGRLLQQLDVCENGAAVLKKWDIISNRF